MEGSFVTVVFTDLVGSTALFDRIGEEAADAIRRRHFDTLRRVAAEHGGTVVKSTGDGLMLTFASAVAAVRCAAQLQRATTEAGDPAMRVGIDAGEPSSDGDDLFGWPVIVASRLCEAAGPGEILASDVVAQIAGRRVAEAMLPAGSLRLAGMAERISTVQVRWRDDDDAGTQPAAAPAAQITVAIADDQQLLRAGFRVIVEAEHDMTVIGEASDGRAAVDLVRRARPDVVLMDIRMPELDGLQAAQQLLADPALGTAVLMLTTFDLDAYVYEALRVGASGFLLKDAPSDRLLDAIRVAAAGEALLAPSITRRLIERFVEAAPSATPAALSELTARELDVLRLVARGLSNAEIAAELVVSENTVKTHVARMLAKLDLRDRVQAVVLAYESGLAGREPA